MSTLTVHVPSSGVIPRIRAEVHARTRSYFATADSTFSSPVIPESSRHAWVVLSRNCAIFEESLGCILNTVERVAADARATLTPLPLRTSEYDQ
jgi:hypothetical protein